MTICTVVEYSEIMKENMNKLKKNLHYKEVVVSDLPSWKKIKEAARDIHRNMTDESRQEWIFRGQRNKGWKLKSTLERALNDFDIPLDKSPEIESGLLRRFQRQYYHFASHVPKKNDSLEWLAIMQHYGAPTRLLDWTYSFYVAVFFAIEKAVDNIPCEVWAIEKYAIRNSIQKSKRIHDNVKSLLDTDHNIEKQQTWKGAFCRNTWPFVYPVNPFRLNERLVIQQGDFLCPGDITKPFEENLIAVLPNKARANDFCLYRYIFPCPGKIKKGILMDLHRMNITQASLFPGLEGFAKSLYAKLASPEDLLAPFNSK